MTEAASFAPVHGPACRALVLGSVPGQASLRAAEYYAHPRNAFWPLFGALLGFDPAAPYAERLGALRDRGVALWDVCRRCRRPGSLDAAIRDVEPNDIAGLAARLPELRAILCNGSKAGELLARHVLRACPPALDGVEVLVLPSTSPANAGITAAARAARWREALGRAGLEPR